MRLDEPRLAEALQELVQAQPFTPDVYAIERRGRRLRRRAGVARGVAGLGLAAVAAASLAAGGVFSGAHATSLTIRSAAAGHGGSLVRLAADIAAHQTHEPGNATLITSLEITRFGSHDRHSERDPGAELFTDAGTDYVATLDPLNDRSYRHRSDAYYEAHPESLLRAEVMAHRSFPSVQFAAEEAAAIHAAHGELRAGRRQMAEALHWWVPMPCRGNRVPSGSCPWTPGSGTTASRRWRRVPGSRRCGRVCCASSPRSLTSPSPTPPPTLAPPSP